MWITKLVLICCIATAFSTNSEIKSKKKSSTELRGKRNLEYSIAHPGPIYGYRAERRISSGPRTNYFPAHKHYITFRRGRPAPSPPPYAVQMEPLVHYSQRDPLYDSGNLPVNPGNDLASDYQHIHPQTYGHPPPPPPKIIEKPIYIKEPEPIIEIIIKESNVTLPPPPAPVVVTPAPKKKEPVHVFYVKYKKNPNGYGKDSIIYDKPIPAISPPVEDEEPPQEEAPQEPLYAAPVTPAPQTPSTTLRAIIKPESDYSGNKHIHVRFEKPSNNQYKRTSTSDDDSKEESAPEPVISQPQSRKFIFPPSPPQGRSPPNFPPKLLSRPPPQFRPEGQRFPPPPPPPSFRPYNQPPSFKPPPFPPSQFPPPPSRPNFHSPPASLDRPPAPSSQQQLPSQQHIPFRHPVAYRPFENYVPSDTTNLQSPSTSFTPPQQNSPITYEQNPNLPPQSFANFLTHFPEQQHLPHVQRHHIFHTPQQQVPQKQFSPLPEQQQVPQLQKHHQFNPQQHQVPEQPKQFLESSHQPQAQQLVGPFGENANKEQFAQHQQFSQQQGIPHQETFQQQQFHIDHNQNLPFHNQLPRLPQHQLLPNSQRLNNFNSIPPQPQHQQQQHPQQHQEESVLPPGGELIPSVSKYEQHITLPSETKEQQTSYQPNSQQKQQQQQHQPQPQHHQSQQRQPQQQHQPQPQQHQPQQRQQQQQQQQRQHQQQQYVTDQQQQISPSIQTLGQQSQYQQYQQHLQQLNNKNAQQQSQHTNFQIKPSEERGNSVSITSSNYLQRNQQQQQQRPQQQQQSVTIAPHRFSSIYSTTQAKTTYQSTTTASPTTTTKSPEKEEKAKKNILELPDEVPEDLRQQLLSSGILENAQISVLDYDKVGDIPLSALPPEQLTQFFGAGGKEAISAGSEPVSSIIRKNGEPLDDLATPDQEPEGSDSAEVKVAAPEVKVVQYEKGSEDEKKIAETYIKEGASQVDPVQLDSENYTRYLPIKVNGAQFPIPDVPELKGKNITSVVVLAPVEYTGTKGRPVREIISTERLLAGQALKELIKNPTTENFQKWLEIENTTAVDKQSVVLLVTKPEEAKEGEEKEIFMYDLNTKTVSKLSGELSSAFVNAAEANTNNNLEAIAPSNIVETRVPYPEIDRRDLVAFTDEDFQYDLSDAGSELVESRIPIIDPMEDKEEDEYEAEASEQLEQFVDISGLKVRPEDLAAAASNTVENQVIVSSGYSKTGSNKMPSQT